MATEPQPDDDETRSASQTQQPSTKSPAGTDTATAPPVVVEAAGPRATRFKDLYAQALDHTLSKLAYDNLAGCYPTIAARNGTVLEHIRAQMANKLDEKCRAEFDTILASRAVVPKLNELEALVADAGARRKEEQRRVRKKKSNQGEEQEEEQEPIPWGSPFDEIKNPKHEN